MAGTEKSVTNGGLAQSLDHPTLRYGLRMVFQRFFALAVVTALLAPSVGCVGPTLIVQQYEGPARPADTIAILRVNGSGSVQLVTLDDADAAVPIARDTRLHLELLPGRHVLEVANVAAPQAPTESVAFDAEAGRVYRVAFVASANASDPNAATAHVYEVDRSGDALLREVTAAPASRTTAPAVR